MMDYSNCTPTYQPMREEKSSLPLVLDLCIRKRPISPDYTLSYPSPNSSPSPVHPERHTLYYASPKSISDGSEASESSSFSDITRDAATSPSSRLKPTRPFKAFPKNPLSLTLDMVTKTNPLVEMDPSTAYEKFRERMLSQMKSNNNGTNKNMRRTQNQNEKTVDPTYLEKRKKNNEAAKRSRDARKAKEDEIAIRCAFLEQENMRLQFKIDTLEMEMDRLRRMSSY